MNDSRPQFGNRTLVDKQEVFKHNAWDNVEWDEQQNADAQKKVAANSVITLSPSQIENLENSASTKWDDFYNIHQNRFFKDRQWLFTEFPELQIGEDQKSPTEPNENDDSECLGNCLDLSAVEKLRNGEKYPGEKASFKIWEVGCGVGNTLFPILERNIDPNLYVYGSDFSSSAISIVKESAFYAQGRCHAFNCDLTSDTWATPFTPFTIDVIVCIFVLSALHPLRAKMAVHNLSRYLKPGGILLFRDYGRYDMAQLRFKKGRCLGDHLYARGDGTMCHFFTQDEVEEMMADAGLAVVQNVVDRRLQVNRGKKLTMYRVWIQAKYKKLS